MKTFTSDMLGRYRRELLSEGFDEEQAFILVQQAAKVLVEVDGLAVGSRDAATKGED